VRDLSIQALGRGRGYGFPKGSVPDPAVVRGDLIHVIYAHPSSGLMHLAPFADVVADGSPLSRPLAANRCDARWCDDTHTAWPSGPLPDACRHTASSAAGRRSSTSLHSNAAMNPAVMSLAFPTSPTRTQPRASTACARTRSANRLPRPALRLNQRCQLQPMPSLLLKSNPAPQHHREARSRRDSSPPGLQALIPYVLGLEARPLSGRWVCT
jgi:hypothetical protein